ncbi:MAG: YdeI/OmpD-associated family protein [Acidobacteria bacterium]|nr:YdeI/OmpD-associated family protein [Acidobacteriota bacterium]
MKTVYLKNRAEWRSWLERNSRNCAEVWLLYYKKGSGKARIEYQDAVEEALCFGWIDGKIKRIDEATYAQRFTPRLPASRWSALNIKRAEKLIEQGKMMEDGLKAFQPGKVVKALPLPTQLPKELEDRFRRESRAWENFDRFPPAYRRLTIGWVASAKKEETRLKRLQQLIEVSSRGEKIKFM